MLESRSGEVPQRFPTLESLETWEESQDSIELHPSTLLGASQDGAVRIIFAAYNQFDELLIPPQPHNNNNIRFINSKVISATVGQPAQFTDRLRDPVRITLKHLRMQNVSNPVCVFWNTSSRAWSGAGCRLTGTNMTHSSCACDHLTSFALMMDEGWSDTVAVTLAAVTDHITTIIACVATLVCVTLLSFVIILTWRRFRVSHQCRSLLQNSGIPCFHKTKEMSEKDKKQGNFYTVTPKLNGNGTEGTGGGKSDPHIELDTEQQYFQHMLAMQKNQETALGNHKTISRRNTLSAAIVTEQETNLCEEAKKGGIADLTNPALRRTLKLKSQCQHAPGGQAAGHGELTMLPKTHNAARAMSPFNHIYMEIDSKTEENVAVYEALNHSETYHVSTLSDMSDEEFRRSSDISRQSSNRYAENKPLIRQGLERNLLHTISGVQFPHHNNGIPIQSQSMRLPPKHQHRTSILSTISGLRYTDPTQPGQPALNLATGEPIISLPPHAVQTLKFGDQQIQTLSLTEEQMRSLNLEAGGISGFTTMQDGMEREQPVQVTTVNGNQFVCLNLAEDQVQQQQQACYASLSDTYVGAAELRGVNTANFSMASSEAGTLHPSAFNTFQPGAIQTPVHSQLVIQRVGTLPRQYAHPLAQL